MSPTRRGADTVVSLFIASCCTLAFGLLFVVMSRPPRPESVRVYGAVIFACAFAAVRTGLAFFIKGDTWTTIGRAFMTCAGGGGMTGGVVALIVFFRDPSVFIGEIFIALIAGVLSGAIAGGISGCVFGPVVGFVRETSFADGFDRVLFILSLALALFGLATAYAQTGRGSFGGVEGFMVTGLAFVGLFVSAVRDFRWRSWLANPPLGWTIELRGEEEVLPSFVVSGDEVLVQQKRIEGGPFRVSEVSMRVAQLDRTLARHLLLGRVAVAIALPLAAVALIPSLLARRAENALHEWRPVNDHPTVIEGFPTPKTVVVASDYACATDGSSRRPRCWGNEAGKALGTPEPGQWRPAEFPHDAERIFAGPRGICSTGAGEAARCWFPRALGGDVPYTPGAPIGPLDPVQLEVRSSYTLALTSSGEMWRWGDYAALMPSPPYPSAAERNGIHRIAELADIQQIAASDSHACALDRAGAVYCWGDDDDGCVSGSTGVIGRKHDTLPPTKVPGLPKADAIATGPHTSWARAEGRWYSWGSLSERKGDIFGTSNAGDGVHAMAGSESVTNVVVTDRYLCALYADHGVRCFPRSYEIHVDMDGLPPGSAYEIAGAGDQLCARGLSEVRCWGAH